ncbi:sulfatase-like hydrolase/transferase [bacterium]|nr:sulfatase-like hydrolase/transferase [bacterium]
MKKPNILLFLLDGMQGRVLGADHVCQTPNFDRLARKGIWFRNAYTPTPTCSPARASLMTGLLAHNHGVLQVEHCVDDDQSALRTDKPHWAQRLADAGYKTGYFGKWHIERSYELEKYGWQTNYCDRGPKYQQALHEKTVPEREHLDPEIIHYCQAAPGYQPFLHYAVTDVPVEQRPISLPTRLGQVFLEEALQTDTPWCVCISHPDPNEAMVCSRDSYEKYDTENIELPENWADPMENRPAMYRRVQKLWSDMTPEKWRQALACYYARISELDQQFGKVLDQIEQAGELDNTIIIVTSDHAKYVGSHGMDAHNWGQFEEIYNIPMVISGPGISENAISDARVGLHDVCPTLLEQVGAEMIDVPDSRSFTTLLSTPDDPEQEFTTAYAEYHGTRFPLAQRVFWDGNFKFIFNGFDEDELYDLAADPHELKNLAAEKKYAPVKEKLMQNIWRRIRDTYDKALYEGHYYSMQFGLMGPDFDYEK